MNGKFFAISHQGKVFGIGSKEMERAMCFAFNPRCSHRHHSLDGAKLLESDGQTIKEWDVRVGSLSQNGKPLFGLVMQREYPVSTLAESELRSAILAELSASGLAG